MVSDRGWAPGHGFSIELGKSFLWRPSHASQPDITGEAKDYEVQWKAEWELMGVWIGAWMGG